MNNRIRICTRILEVIRPSSICLLFYFLERIALELDHNLSTDPSATGLQSAHGFVQQGRHHAQSLLPRTESTMSSSEIEQPTNQYRPQVLSLSLILIITVLVYWPGLDGPFLFDDTVHIAKNLQVHIADLSFDSLAQAWHSSLAPFPSSRPLAQLSFGINHAISGLSPFAFKATNLGIHLVNGCLVFLLGL